MHFPPLLNELAILASHLFHEFDLQLKILAVSFSFRIAPMLLAAFMTSEQDATVIELVSILFRLRYLYASLFGQSMYYSS